MTVVGTLVVDSAWTEGVVREYCVWVERWANGDHVESSKLERVSLTRGRGRYCAFASVLRLFEWDLCECVVGCICKVFLVVCVWKFSLE